MPLVCEGKDIPSIIPDERKNAIFNYIKTQNSISTSITNNQKVNKPWENFIGTYDNGLTTLIHKKL